MLTRVIVEGLDVEEVEAERLVVGEKHPFSVRD
jgi:hypothetical protein